MRLTPTTDGLTHPPVHTPDDHHPRPVSIGFENSSQSLPPGTEFDLDIPLPHAGFKIAHVVMTGPRQMGSGSLWRECAEVHVTTAAAEAIGTSNFHQAWKQTYNATYSKQNGDSFLTHKIFDSDTGSSAMYINLVDAQIVGAVLRLTFRNHFGGSATLWVKGQVTVE